MPAISTLGHPARRSNFSYIGSIAEGVTIQFNQGRAKVSAEFFAAILDAFRGQTVRGGFIMVDPPPGLGKWVLDHSEAVNTEKLSPRHASFIAAILVHEAQVSSSLDGNAVYLSFPQ